MNKASLTDREQQVCLVGLKMYLDTILRETETNAHQINNFDVLDHKHAKAHIITAFQKFGINPTEIATLQNHGTRRS